MIARVWLVLAALLGARLAWSQESVPLAEFLREAATRTQTTEIELQEHGAAFERATILPVFDSRTKETAEWRDEARAFLTDACEWLSGDRRRLDAESMQARARTLIEDGCGDSLVHMLAYSVFEVEPASGSRSYAMLNRMRLLENSGYPAHRIAAARIAHLGLRREETTSYDTERREALGAIEQAMRSGAAEWTTHTREYVWRKLSPTLRDSLSYRDLQYFHRDLGGVGRFDPWLWNMARGVLDYKRAWHVRGGTTWDRVPEERKLEYLDALEKATAHLLAAAALEPTVPDPHSVLLAIAVEGAQPGGRGADDWFRSAVGVRFDCRSAYVAYLRHLQARWGGGPTQTLEFARACAATARFDTFVPEAALEAIEQLGSEIGSAQTAWTHEQTVPIIDAVLDGYLAQPNAPIGREYLLSVRAAVAWWRRDFSGALAAAPMRTSGRYIDPLAAELTRAKAESVLRDALALGGEHAEAVSRAIASAGTAGAADAIEALDAAISSIGDESHELRLALRDLRIRIEISDALSRGEWATVPFEAGFPGWRRDSGDWEVTEPSRARARTANSRAILLLSEAWGSRVELETEIRPAEGGAGRWGVILAYREDGYGLVYRSVLVDPYRRTVTAGAGLSARTVAQLPEGAGPILLRVAVWDDHAALWADDELVYAGRIQGDSWQGWGASIGIGGALGTRSPSEWSGLRFRILTAPPPDLAGLVAEEP